jgi:ubiquinone/menaquinone biosynthesis C-methylase UbiE
MSMNDTGNTCWVCGKKNFFAPPVAKCVLLREERCNACGASRRNSAAAFGILAVGTVREGSLGAAMDAGMFAEASILETGSIGAISEAMRRLPGYACFEYFDDVEPGQSRDGIRCENLERLTYSDGTFDLVVSEDVFEHVDDFERGFSEVFRVLKPGGTFVLTVPMNEFRPTRRRRVGGRDAYPGVYHGDPIRSIGAIVTVEYGSDLGEMLRNVGFHTRMETLNAWHTEGEVTDIGSESEYREYSRLSGNPLEYFRYNNQVFICTKETHMDFTGERMIPDDNRELEIYLEHIARYKFASQLGKGKDVLDIACGSGYGSDFLVKAGAKHVVGVDISEEAIRYCKWKYTDDALDFVVGSVERIPMEDNSVDLVVSFETIEHVDEDAQKAFLSEIRRVLRSDGRLLMSTPNVDFFPKGNPFHVHELTQDEFTSMLGEKFENVSLYFQNNTQASSIFSAVQLRREFDAEDGDGIGMLKINVLPEVSSLYFLALCGNQDLPTLRGDVVVSNINQGSKSDEMARFGLDIRNLQDEIDRQATTIKTMESSKFWAFRTMYMRLKDKILRK